MAFGRPLAPAKGSGCCLALGKCSYLEMWPQYHQVYYLKRLEICIFVQKKKKNLILKC